jgi:RNA polymerase sigma-70 factor (ECF subfamily)
MPRVRATVAADHAAAHDTTDHEIVAVSGAHAAFEQLYRETADRVYGLCLRMAGDRRRAAALAQDVFVRVWRERDRRQPEADPRDAVWRLAVQVALGAERAAGRHGPRVALVEAVEATTDGAPPRVTAAAPRGALADALRRLPPRARAAFVLHDMEGCTDAQVAELLGTSTATARAQLHRARASLRAALRAALRR